MMRQERMPIGQVEHHTLNQRIYAKLLELIFTGVLAPGSRLDEQVLADQLSVSRTPIREAIGRIAKEGLVEYIPYRGNFVRTYTPKQVDDLFAVRKALECLAARLAVNNLSDQDLGHMRAILDEVADALARGDMAGYASADQRFHDAIARVAGNEALMESVVRLQRQIQLVRVVANRDPGVVERTAAERPRILAALESRDADRAAQLLGEHIDGVRDSVITQL